MTFFRGSLSTQQYLNIFMLESIINFIYYIPNIVLFFIINIILAVFCIVSLYLTKNIIPNIFQKEELGSLGGFLSGVVGSMYAVSTGFVLLYLLENFNKAEEVVALESISLMRLADTASWLPDPLKLDIYQNLKDYTNHVINNEWALMQEGKHINSQALSHLQHIVTAIKLYKNNDPMQLFIKQNIIDGMQKLYNVRYNRINISYFSLNIQYWVIVFLMTVINLIFVCMIGTKLYLHNISIVLVCITASSMIFLLLILDKPFRGQFAVNHLDLTQTISYIDQFLK